MIQKTLTIVFFLLLPFNIKVFVQTTTGNLKGTIREFLGPIVPNAQIILNLKSETKPFTKSTTSNEKGEFTFFDLSAGIYQIEVKANDQVLFRRTGFSVRSGETIQYSIELGTDCTDESGRKTVFTEAEKAQIVNQLLEDSLIKKQSPDFSYFLTHKDFIILSTKNIKPEWVNLPENIKIKLMSEAEIRQKVKESGDFLFLAFSEFEVRGDCLMVTFDYDWSNPSDINNSQTYPQGALFIYRKESGKLVWRMISSWIR
jgi:hypothetical protein